MKSMFFSLGLVSCLFLGGMTALAVDNNYTWTGQGSDNLFTTAENWSDATPIFSSHPLFGLTMNPLKNVSVVLPTGANAVTRGFYIDKINIDVAGKLDSIRSQGDGFAFNGFWMMGSSTITLEPTAQFTLHYTNGNPDSAQLTMRSDNTFTKFDSGILPFSSMFVGGSDQSGGDGNQFNQHAGTVTATNLEVGTAGGFTKVNQFNLYGGTASVTNTYLQTYTTNTGNGEIGIYGGSFKTSSLSGGTSTDNSQEYRSNIIIGLNNDTAEGYGTFTQTGTSNYTGKITVTAKSPILTVSNGILTAPLVSLNTLSGNETLTLDTPLVKSSDDGKTVSLDPSKKVNTTTYNIGESLDFVATNAGYLDLPASGDPFIVSLHTNAFADTTEIGSFVEWINENTDAYTAQATGLSSILLSTFAPGPGRTFLWDFSDYAGSAVTVSGFSSQHVPEPAAWLLMIAGLLGMNLRRRSKK